MMNLLTLKRFAAGVMLACLGSCGTSTPPIEPPITQPKPPPIEQPIEPPKPPPIEPPIDRKVDSPEKEEILAQLYDRQKQLDLCAYQLERSRSRSPFASAVYSNGKQNYLVEVLCSMAAYQGNYEYYFVKKTDSDLQISPLTLTVLYHSRSGEKWQEQKVISGQTGFDLSSQTLSVYTKMNAAGTCGSVGHYEFKGNSFQMVKYFAKECDRRRPENNYPQGPENYPQIYPSTTNN